MKTLRDKKRKRIDIFIFQKDRLTSIDGTFESKVLIGYTRPNPSSPDMTCLNQERSLFKPVIVDRSIPT